MLEFGASFKKARESRNVSIDKIALETRISTRFLRAIESEQFDVLPGGLFNRGFIRTYAGRLGLDPEEAIRAYEKLSRTGEVEPARHENERVRGKTTKIPVYYVAIAGLLILVVVFYVWTHRSEPPLVTAVAEGSSAANSTGEKAAETPAVIPVANPEPAPLESVAVTSAVPAPAISPATPASNSSVVLELEVREESWLKLSSDGATVVMGEVLAPGTTRRYTASNTINVSIGNAAGVLLRVNGQPISSLGRSGQVRSMTITPKTTAESLSVALR